MGMSADGLNRRVRIERRQIGTDDWNQPLEWWEAVATVWANIKGQTGLGSITRAQEGVAASVDAYSVRIRYREGLDAGMRVRRVVNGVPDGPPFDIRQVRMDYERREWTDLICEVGGSNG